ncbi:MAG TPA: PAS domain S-box protein [Acidobacteriota bacterium]|nr:PAS domain S-box protein [Acidobacteriota bacterium]
MRAMQVAEACAAGQDRVAQAGERLFRWHQSDILIATDRFFAWLLLIQWLAGIVVAVVVSPLTWSGTESSIHFHAWTAVFFGALIVTFPVLLAFRQPGALLTRCVVATGQMLFSALLIHLSGGRIETHFHVFGSLAMLAFYRDWRVFIPAAAVVGLDHFVRGVYWPQSVFGVLTASPWRWVEHVGWVVFELAFLIPSCRKSLEEMRQIAKRQAQLEESRRAEEERVRERTAELSASEARFRTLSASSPVGILELVNLKSCSYANERLLSIMGLESQEQARDLSQLIHPDDRQEVLDRWRQCDPRQKELIQEFRIVSRDRQEIRWVNMRATRTGLAAPLGGCFVATVEDITSAKRSAEDLKRLNHEIELILKSVAEGLCGIDAKGRIVFVNPAFTELTGYEGPQILNRHLRKLCENWPVGELAKRLPDILEGRETSSLKGEAVLSGAHGRTLPVEWALTPIRESGRVAGAVLTFRDVSEEQLLQTQLLQAQKLESIGQLAAGIAHEINTPIQYVGDNTRFLQEAFEDIVALLKAACGRPHCERCLLAAENLPDGLPQEELQFLLEEIPQSLEQTQSGLRRVSKIVQAMKEFSHPARECTPTDLNRAIQSTVTVARNEWKYVAELRTELDPSLPQVPCLPDEFNQVILNMIVNAAHAIREKIGEQRESKGVITIRTRREGEWALIEVRDTGCGIPEGNLGRIFDPFFTTKEVGLGTGQGLAIAHSVVVKKHKGQLTVESKQGQYTVFYIRLPFGEGLQGRLTA